MPTSARTVLLVEDDVDILEQIAGYLRRRNFHVVTAPDFDSGQRALEDAGRYPDVLVTDVNLPDGDGLDLLAQVNRRIPPPPRPRVIVMSGHLDEPRARKAAADGAAAVLMKPFSLGTLLGHLRPAAA